MLEESLLVTNVKGNVMELSNEKTQIQSFITTKQQVPVCARIHTYQWKAPNEAKRNKNKVKKTFQETERNAKE